MSRTYKNIILTNHAYDRIKSRSISDYSIYDTINYPDKKISKANNSVKYIKDIGSRKYHVVATYKKDQKKYLVISAWVRGEDDRVPIIWQLITFPFKAAFWIIKLQFKIIWKLIIKLW